MSSAGEHSTDCTYYITHNSSIKHTVKFKSCTKSSAKRGMEQKPEQRTKLA